MIVDLDFEATRFRSLEVCVSDGGLPVTSTRRMA